MALLKFRGIYLEDFERLEEKDPNTRYLVFNSDGTVYGEYVGDKLIGIRSVDFESVEESVDELRLDIDYISSRKQDKLIAGDNITIDPSTNVISSRYDEPDGVTILLDGEGKLKVSEKLEIDGGYL